MKCERRIGLVVSLGIVAILVMAAFPVRAANINAERTETWRDSGNAKVHGVAAEDIDGDGTTEIVTVGETLIGTPPLIHAQLRIYTWDGTTLSIEKTYEWMQGTNVTFTIAYGIYIGKLDGDNDYEMAVVGKTGDASGQDFMIRIFTWDGTTLGEVSSALTGIGDAYYSVYAADILGGSYLGIVAVGDVIDNPYDGIIDIWYFDGTRLNHSTGTTWGTNNDISAKGVYAADVDNDGVIELVTVGYYRQSAVLPKQGQLRIWNYANGNINLEKEDNQPENYGQTTEWYGVYLGNVDNDAVTEIVVTGYGYDSSVGCNNGVLRIWTWTGTPRVLNSEKNYPWPLTGSDTISYSVYAKSFAGNYQQIVSGGKTTVSGIDYAQLKIWNWTGAALNDVASTTWATNNRNTAVNSIYIKEVDSDNKLEILSGGQTYDGTYWNSQLRISNLTW